MIDFDEYETIVSDYIEIVGPENLDVEFIPLFGSYHKNPFFNGTPAREECFDCVIEDIPF